MFFSKKIISAFLLPMPIFIFLILIGLIFLMFKSYRKAKILFIVSLVWIFLFSSTYFSNKILEPLEKSYKPLLYTPKNIEYVLVLGNSHYTNFNLGIVSQMNQISITRMAEAIRHYNNSKNIKIITSGYSGPNDITPHALMQEKLAISQGVNPMDIIRQDYPRDTFEEAQSVKEFVGDKPFILVTNSFHMKRAMEIFKKAGLNPIPSPVGYMAHEKYSYYNFISGKNLYKSEIAFHEYLGILWENLKYFVEKIKDFKTEIMLEVVDEK